MNQRIFALLLLALVATSATALELTVDPTTLFLPSGETESVTVTVTNTRNESVELVNFTRVDTTDVTSSTPSLPQTIANESSISFTIDVTSASAGTRVVTFRAEDDTGRSAQRTLPITVPQEPGFSVSAFEAGSDTQRRDRTVTGTLTIANEQNLDVTGLTFTSTVPARYGLNLTGVPNAIDRFDTAPITYELYVPSNQDSGRERIGDIVFTSNEVAFTLPVYLTVQSGLVFDDIEFETERDRSRRLQDGDRIDIDFEPGDDVQVRVVMLNQLDIDIEDVRVEMTVERIDDRRDIRERSDRFDIRDGRDEIYEFEFTIPRDVREDTYRVVFFADGIDEDGVRHEVRAELDLRVERERDALRFVRMDVTPTSVCPGDVITFDMLIANVGTRSQDRGRVVAQLMNLDVAEEQSFSVEAAGRRNDEFLTTFNLRVPQDATPGTYTARGIAYYRDSIQTDIELRSITVRECVPPTEPTDPTDPSNGVIIIDPITPPPQPPVEEPAPERGDVYLWLLIGLNVLVVIIVLGLVIRLLFR